MVFSAALSMTAEDLVQLIHSGNHPLQQKQSTNKQQTSLYTTLRLCYIMYSYRIVLYRSADTETTFVVIRFTILLVLYNVIITWNLH